MDIDQLRYYSRWNHHANQRAYAAPAEPFRPIHVDPSGIEFHTQRFRLDRGIGRVEGGEWDRDSLEPLAETTTYRTLHERFEEGRDWTETPVYEHASERFEAGERVRGYETMEAFRATRLAYLEDLYESISQDGYRSNADAGHDPATEDNPFESAYVHHLEPLVTIGREGTIALAEGFHRTIMASIAGVDAIPIQVLCRHEQWQQVRDRVAEADGVVPDAAETTPDHPDLADVVGP